MMAEGIDKLIERLRYIRADILARAEREYGRVPTEDKEDAACVEAASAAIKALRSRVSELEAERENLLTHCLQVEENEAALIAERDAAFAAGAQSACEACERIATAAAVDLELIDRLDGQLPAVSAFQDACNYIAAAIRARSNTDTGPQAQVRAEAGASVAPDDAPVINWLADELEATTREVIGLDAGNLPICAPRVPDGWQLVPKEPSWEILIDHGIDSDTWAALLAASPTPPAAEAVGGDGVDASSPTGSRAIAQERDEVKARCAVLQAKLWSILKERRDDTSFAALTAKQDLDWAIAQGFNDHLPTLEEVQAAGPYVRVAMDETLQEAIERSSQVIASGDEGWK